MANTPIDELVLRFHSHGIDVSPEQAETMAKRISGSIEAHLALMDQTDRQTAEYRPLDIPVDRISDKLKEPLSQPMAAKIDMN